MKRKLFWLIILLCMCLAGIDSCSTGQDANEQMWRGNQDALVLGKILQIDDESIALKVEKRLFPKGIIDETYRQVPGEEIDDEIMLQKFQEYETSYHDKKTPEIGDMIIISLDRGNRLWKVNWPPFEVSGEDYKTLEFLPTEKETPESFAWSTFVKTDGKINDFTFVNETNERKVIGKGKFDDGEIIEDEIYVKEKIPFTIDAY